LSQKEANQLAQSAFENLTAASNALLLQGDVDVYQRTRRDISKLLPQRESDKKSNPDIGPNNSAKDAEVLAKEHVQWEYKGNEDGQIHGPFTTQQILSWTLSGYFVGKQAVQIRTVKLPSKEEDSNLSTTDELLSDLMGDDDDQEKTVSSVPCKGDWLSSNEVDFTAYR